MLTSTSAKLPQWFDGTLSIFSCVMGDYAYYDQEDYGSDVEGDIDPPMRERSPDIKSEDEETYGSITVKKRKKKLNRTFNKQAAEVSSFSMKKEGFHEDNLARALAAKELGVRPSRRHCELYSLLAEKKRQGKLFSYLEPPQDLTELDKKGKMKNLDFNLFELLDPLDLTGSWADLHVEGTKPWIDQLTKMSKAVEGGPIHVLTHLESSYMLEGLGRIAAAARILGRFLPTMLTAIDETNFSNDDDLKLHRWTLKTAVNFIHEELESLAPVLTQRTGKVNRNIQYSNTYKKVAYMREARKSTFHTRENTLQKSGFVGEQQYKAPVRIKTTEAGARREEKRALNILTGIVRGSRKKGPQTPKDGRSKKEKRNANGAAPRKGKGKGKRKRGGEADPAPPSKKQKSDYERLPTEQWAKMSRAERKAYIASQKKKN